MTRKHFLSLLLLIAFNPLHAQQTVSFSSGEYQTNLIELYTSEGCSSCPRADKWLSKLNDERKLWEEYIPLALHVDYWDYLGWSDRLAEHEFSLRQSKHKEEGNIRSVYTPGFVVNGSEWRGFFGVDRTIPQSGAKPGRMHLEAGKYTYSVQFDPAQDKNTKYHLAILGNGFAHQIKAGENGGKTLKHDFAVIALDSTYSENGVASFNAPIITHKGAKQYAIVAWASNPDSLKPIQAVGGWLPENLVKTAF
ncbi:DUF1223 domain-containing protein [Marinicella sp. W31]|uniref:DUF1223 domain-containing protein n=1 Tax=Marinicella sp. W31 TaxID=3023713 RepID=UPI0037578E31